MPELPEVHTILRAIKPEILNKKITGFTVTPKGLKLIAPFDQKTFSQSIIDKKFTSIRRLGKFMIFNLSDGQRIIGHLRMSGRLIVTHSLLKHKHNRLYVKFADGTYLNFIDTRRFATFHLILRNAQYKGLQKLGTDALSPALSAKAVYQKFQTRKKSIYSTLLDQSIIAGLGNIYVNEVLFASKIHPLKAANSISLKETRLLLQNTKKILTKAIGFKGTTLLDKTYLDGGGKEGEFYKMLKIYDRENEPCRNCDTEIIRIRIGNRSVYYCPNCQVEELKHG